MPFRPLTEADLPRAVALSAMVGWNQAAADWRVFLDQGRVVGLDDGEPACLAATAAVLPHGPDLAWISMVLVRPDRRREGLATRLMRWAVQALAGTRCIALDATPEGREVYRRLGFADAFGFTRWRLPRPPAASPAQLRPVAPSDWPALLAMDHAAFGAPREHLLRGLVLRCPAAAWIAPDGFALGRDGVRHPQIGPVVARDPATALALIGAASRGIAQPALIDLAETTGLAATLHQSGAERLRPFTRMTLGALPPGIAQRLVAVAGPEFG